MFLPLHNKMAKKKQTQADVSLAGSKGSGSCGSATGFVFCGSCTFENGDFRDLQLLAVDYHYYNILGRYTARKKILSSEQSKKIPNFHTHSSHLDLTRSFSSFQSATTITISNACQEHQYQYFFFCFHPNKNFSFLTFLFFWLGLLATRKSEGGVIKNSNIANKNGCTPIPSRTHTHIIHAS